MNAPHSPDAAGGPIERFAALANLFGDTLLLVSRPGEIRWAGSALALLLARPVEGLVGAALYGVVADSSESVDALLRTASRSRNFVPGTLSFIKGTGEAVDCRCDGALYVGAGQDALIALRVRPKEQASSEFIALGEKIRQLSAEITARKKAEDTARLWGARYEVTLQSIGDAVIATDAAGRITFMNQVAEELTGWPAGDALERHLDEVFVILNEETREVVESPVSKVLRIGQIVGLANHTVLVRRDGSVLPIADSGAPIRQGSGPIEGVVLVFRDVSERLASEEMLRQVQKTEALGRLTGGMAHDFNNLLTVILGNSELLSEQLAGDARLGPLARMVTESALRGAELTHRLLAFARRQPLAPKTVDMNELIGGMDGLLRRTLGEHVEIGFVRGPGPAMSLVDPAQLESALLNLCINSRDAMPGGGRLTIETSSVLLDQDYAARNVEVQPGEYVMVAVSDTGSGIAAQDLSRVFEPFYTTKPTGKGTGLGLSMVYGFVKQSRGHVSIYSEPGKGTTVRMYLPRTSRAAEAQQPRIETNIRGGVETILLVEDDELVRCYAGEQLRSLGYTVIEAGNGAEALKLLEQHGNIDLLFTDVVMPGMSGRELADAAQRLRPGLKVLYTSGYTENAIVHHGRLDPGVQLLSKPYRRAELASKIRAVLV